MNQRDIWYQMRHELRLMRRIFRQRKSDVGVYRRCLWLGERVMAYARQLPCSGTISLR